MISISVATPSELPEIATLLQGVRGDSSGMNNGQFIVAKDGSEVVGCVRIKELDKYCLELASLAVKEEYRGRGIGSKLIGKVLSVETKRPIYLLCFKTKQGFYERVGFKIVPVTALPSILKLEYDRVYEKIAGSKLEIIAMSRI